MKLTQRWSLIQHMNKQFWKSWSREYLQQLQSRSKWTKPTENIQAGDIVLISDDNTPPGKWPLGKVCEVHPGKDGYVRVASVKTKNNIIRRPIVKLAKLPVQTNISQTPDQTNNNEDKQKQQRSSKRTIPNILHIALIFFMMLICNSSQQDISTAAYNITPLPDNQLIYYDHVTSLQHIRDNWNLIIYYNMTSYWKGIENINNYIAHLKEICTDKHLESQYRSIMLQLDQQFNELQHHNMLLTFNNRRQKRGLLNGVGYATNYLFGVLDDRFAQQYEKDIEKISQNENHLLELLKNQTSVLEVENNIIQRNEHVMKKQLTLIGRHLKQVSTEINRVVQDNSNSNYVISSAFTVSIILYNLQYIQRTIIDTITNINHGKIDSYLLPPQQLQNQADIIAGQLPADLTLPVSKTAMTDLYKLLRVFAKITSSYLIIEVKIPLVRDEMFELNKLITVPQKRGAFTYLLIPTIPFIAYNIRKDTALLLTETDLGTCYELPSKILCPINSPAYNIKLDQSFCNINIAQYVHTRPNKDISLCNAHTTACKETWIKLHRDNTWIYSCCGECSVRILCTAVVTMTKLKDRGIIKIGQGCTVKSNEFTIFAHNDFLSKISIQRDYISPEESVLNKIMTHPEINYTELEASNSNNIAMYNKIKDQISTIKDQANQKLSVHESHHYIQYSLYIILATFGVIGVIVWRWRKCQQADRRTGDRPAVVRPEPADTTTTREDSDSACASAVIVESARLSSVRDKFSLDEPPMAPRLTRFKSTDN